jgi:uncharacterized protein (TIGR03118 family)
MRTWFRGLRKSTRPRQPSLRLEVEGLEQRALLSATGYLQTNLVSSVPGLAPHTDADLINPWGFTETPQGQFRVSANGSGEAILLNAKGAVLGKPVILPTPSDSPPGSTATPNGQVINTTSDFVIRHGGKSAPASVLFSTEDGTIIGWNPAVDKREGVIGADLSDSGAVFKLLAAGTDAHGNVLFATDFHNDRVDIFDKNFQVVGSFTDPNPHAGFAPFGVKNINGTLFVTFAKQDDPNNAHDDVEGPGNGFIDEFTTDGTFIKRFATGSALQTGGLDALNSPIGMAVAPSNFGQFSSTATRTVLLVGNFGDSHVSAFDMSTGQFLGQLSDAQGNPLVLNGGFQETDKKGLWGIGFGNGHGGAATNALFFASGINAENDGLFGKVTVTDGDNDHADGHHGDGNQAVLSSPRSSSPAGSTGQGSMSNQSQDSGPGQAALAELEQALKALGSGPITPAEVRAVQKAILDLVFAESESNPLG